jgi:hypothetical protein
LRGGAARIPPFGALTALAYFYSLDEYSIAHERLRDHPAELRRIDSLMSITLNRFDELVDAMKKGGGRDPEEIRRELAAGLKLVRGDIREDEIRGDHFP